MKNYAFPVWYPLFTVGVLTLAIYVLHRNWGWWRSSGYQMDLWIPLILGCVTTFIVWMGALWFAYGLSDFVSHMSEQESRICWKAKMVSLRGVDGASGSMAGGIFMMSGHMGSGQFYRYYTAGSDGAFHPRQWKANDRTRIFEEDRKDGEVIQWDEHFVSDWVYWFAEPSDEVAMDFHIPRGSLKQSFALE